MRTRTALWRSTPPAVFPPILGLFGLGIAWRRVGVGAEVADFIVGATGLVFVFFLASYAAKFIHRPSALVEDLKVLPGRAGLAAMSVAMMAFAAGLVPLAPGAAKAVLVLALSVHAALAVTVIAVFAGMPAEARPVTPAWHLSFVGFIVAPLAAGPLGWDGLVRVILWGTLPVAAVIYGISLVQLLRRAPAAPLRPLMAVHLAPLGLFGHAALLLGDEGLATVFAALAVVVAVALLARFRWLTEAGFSPLWGAFTFPPMPLVALILALSAGSPLLHAVGVGLLAAATIFIPWIAFRIGKMWTTGMLAKKTNAAMV